MTEIAVSGGEEHRTLWVGDVESWWDEQYAASLFSGFGGFHHVKLMRDKRSGQLQGYGFVVFETREQAQGCLEQLNGQSMPNSARKYRLNWATMSRNKRAPDAASGQEEWCLFVGDLVGEVNDYALQQFFAERFPRSVRGARVVMDQQTGNSKGYGFVRFSSEDDYSRALSEMSGQRLRGRAIRVSVAQPRRDASSSPQPQHRSSHSHSNAAHGAGGSPQQSGSGAQQRYPIANAQFGIPAPMSVSAGVAGAHSMPAQSSGSVAGVNSAGGNSTYMAASAGYGARGPAGGPGGVPVMPGMVPAGMIVPGMDATTMAYAAAAAQAQYPYMMYPNIYYPPSVSGAAQQQFAAMAPTGLGMVNGTAPSTVASADPSQNAQH